MIKIVLNNSMFNYLTNVNFDKLDYLFPIELQELLEEGLVQFRGGTFYNFVAGVSNTKGDIFEDIVGVEYNENILYMPEYFEGGF